MLIRMPDEQRAALVWRWKNNYERAEHLFATWRIDVWLEKRPLPW